MDISLDLRPPPSKRHKEVIIFEDCTHFDTSVDSSYFTNLRDIEHHFVDLIKWEDENGVQRELRIYSKIAHKWSEIAMDSSGL